MGGCQESTSFDTGKTAGDTANSDIDGEVDLTNVQPVSGGSLTRISKKYHLPFHSGERYTATTYPYHDGWDFNMSGDCGQPVIAVADGYVNGVVNTYDYNSYGSLDYGNYVRIDHSSDSYTSRYAHLDQVYVQYGQWVERGQAIGTIGNTGNSIGCHLHFEIETSSGSPRDPKFRYYSGGSKRVGYLTNGSSYTSYNHGKIADARTSAGTSRVGTATSVTASRVASDGFSKTFTGGTWGTNSIYYQAKGCSGGDFCPSYNNTSYGWVVRTGFYAYYNACGGPAYCSLGFPTGNEYAISGGARQNFEHGYLIYVNSTGVTHQYSY